MEQKKLPVRGKIPVMNRMVTPKLPYCFGKRDKSQAVCYSCGFKEDCQHKQDRVRVI